MNNAKFAVGPRECLIGGGEILAFWECERIIRSRVGRIGAEQLTQERCTNAIQESEAQIRHGDEIGQNVSAIQFITSWGATQIGISTRPAIPIYMSDSM